MYPARALPLAAAAALAALAACAPAVESSPPRVTSGVVAGEAGYYPAAAGLTWIYLPDGDPITAPPYTLRVEGPSVLDGETLTAVSFTGRGQKLVYYRSFDKDGVRLHARVAPQIVTEHYDPPIQEYPPSERLTLGATWGGETTVTQKVVTTGATTTAKLTYRYRVLADENFRVGDTTYKTLLINLSGTLPGGAALNETIRFVPRVGEVRTREGLVLVTRNF
jgi:hypothetical protein